MRNFQDTFETSKRSFVSAFSICMTIPITELKGMVAIQLDFILLLLLVVYPTLNKLNEYNEIK